MIGSASPVAIISFLHRNTETPKHLKTKKHERIRKREIKRNRLNEKIILKPKYGLSVKD